MGIDLASLDPRSRLSCRIREAMTRDLAGRAAIKRRAAIAPPSDVWDNEERLQPGGHGTLGHAGR